MTTTTVFADIVQNVGGDRGRRRARSSRRASGPEDYEPKPDDAKQLARRAADRLERRRARRLPRQAARVRQRRARRRGSSSAMASRPSTVDGEQNPHFWLDPTPRQAVLPAGDRRRSSPSSTRPARRRSTRTPRPTARQLDALDAELKAKVETIPRGQPQARHVPRRVPVLRQALRLRARSASSSQNVGPGADRGRARGARRQGQGGRRQGGLQRGPVQPEARPRPSPRRPASRRSSRRSTTMPSGRRRPTPTSG